MRSRKRPVALPGLPESVGDPHTPYSWSHRLLVEAGAQRGAYRTDQKELLVEKYAHEDASKFLPYKILTLPSIIQTVDEDRHIEYNDGTKKVFLSTLPEQEGSMRPALRAFLDYMNDNVPSSDLAIRVDEAVNMIKKHQKWRKEYMLLEEKYSEFLMEGREEGRKEGIQEGRAELIRRMHHNGMQIDDIVTFTQMTEEEVQGILNPLS